MALRWELTILPTNNLLASSGNVAWDVPSNWSLGQVPQAGDDVGIAGSSSGSLTVSIAATDPAYMVASLTESTANTSGLESLSVSGKLTVTGATNITSGMLSLLGSATVALNAVTLANSAQIITGNAPSSNLSIVSLMGSGSPTGGTLTLGSGAAAIGSVSGSVSVNVTSGAVTVGTTAGNSFFSLSSGRLNLQSSAMVLGDTVNPLNNTNVVDLLAIAYQPGETSTATLVKSGFLNVYRITLNAPTGQTLYTFQAVDGVGNFNAQMAPLVSLASDGTGGTAVTLACYTAGTRIAVPGGEARVSDLIIGDEVVTAAGRVRAIKWIGTRSYAGRFLKANPNAMPVRFRANSLADGVPCRDLLVSPEHAMLIDGLLVPARHLVNNRSITQETGLDRVDYFHVELDTHDVILAEGAASETFVDDNSRRIFHNAQEFTARYPDVGSPPALYCAPRAEDGEALAAIRRVIDIRAGVAQLSSRRTLRGSVDGLDGAILRGWAQDTAWAEAPVCLAVHIDGVSSTHMVADVFRPDLLAAGLGSGCHGFRVRLPASARHARIDVVRASDGAVLGSWGRSRAAA